MIAKPARTCIPCLPGAGGNAENFEPLTRRVYEAFGWFPIPGDEHLCEYLPWVSDPLTRPWEKYTLSLYDWDAWDALRGDGHAAIARMADGQDSVDELRETIARARWK